MAKIKLHPLFLALGVVLIFLGKGALFLWTLLALFFHETAHMLAAKSRGYLLGELTLMPYGACLWGEEKTDSRSMAYIAVAGPLANLVVLLAVMAVWWAFPETEKVLKTFFWANLSLLAFNFLPAFPLDGSRLILAVSKNKLRALKILKGVGIALSLIMFALFLASAFFDINYSLGIIAVFLFIGAVFGSEKEAYCHIYSNRRKDYFNGVEKKTVIVSSSAPLVNLLKKMNCNTEITVVVDSDKGRRTLDEKQLGILFEKNELLKPIGKTLNIDGSNRDKTQNAVKNNYNTYK